MKENNKESGGNQPTRGRFGTFKGVFIPSILTILGVIMYLRMGWVVGHMGLVKSLIIITMASAITFITGLSIAATATNMKVEGGGAYFMISRSFGIEAGAAIGLPLYFAQTLGITFYITGFAESVHYFFPQFPALMIGLISLVALGLLSYFSAALALKAQSIIFSVIILSLVSFLFGSNTITSPEGASPTLQLSYWTVFAVFFPAVTGIEAGLSMSGELKNPEKSLPIGTLSAIVIGYVVYAGLAVFMFYQFDKSALINNSMIMSDYAWSANVVIAGIWGATLSSALGALLGAPRTLQALAKDRVVPGKIGKGFGPSAEPRIATAISFIIAAAALFLGDLNVIGTLLTMFFLTSYGMLNLAATVEGFIGNPSWRPTFRSPWWISFIGALACLLIMLMIDAGATITATFVTIIVYTVTKKRNLAARWSDIRYAALILITRWCLYTLSKLKTDVKSWRPNILALSETLSSDSYLFPLADALTHGKGFLTVATIKTQKELELEKIQQWKATFRDFLEKRGIPAMVEIKRSESFKDGMFSLVQHYGMGAILPNLLMIEFDGTEKKIEHAAHLTDIAQNFSRNALLIRSNPSWQPWSQSDRQRVIHIWLGKNKHDNGLLLSLAYLLQRSTEWSGAEIILFSRVTSEDQKKAMQTYLEHFIKVSRLEAILRLVKEEGDSIEQIRNTSSHASLVMATASTHTESEEEVNHLVKLQVIASQSHDMPPIAWLYSYEGAEFGSIFE